ncbi:hypothetical protein DL96DRAFT_1711533 [Flagelloscypha sp. PMI_526]|nr:hypothetical protein DL96DRAFT_1711533 [Flagelloscypha sp. PMI_526]
MSSSSFSRFQDLPLEIQNEIWHYFAGYSGNKEELTLLRVSRNSRLWAGDRIYHTVSIKMSNAARVMTAVQRNPTPFQEKTHQLELSIYSPHALDQAQEILPIFRSLRRARLEFEFMDSGPAEVLFRNPNLEELTMDCGAYSFPASARAHTLAHPILEDWSARPWTPPVVLAHFPQLTHLAVRRFGEITDPWLRAWCDTCPSTLYVFLAIDMRSVYDQHVPIHISRPLMPRPVVANTSFYTHFFWKTYPAMWAATEAAIQCAEIEQINKNYIQIE